jgi:type II secretory pathway component PulF
LGLLAEHSDTAYQYHRFYRTLEAALQEGNTLRNSFWYASRGVGNPLQTNTALAIGLLEKNPIAYALDQSGAFSPLEIVLLHKGQEENDLLGAIRTIIADEVLAPK